jgi:hypothetical protein
MITINKLQKVNNYKQDEESNPGYKIRERQLKTSRLEKGTTNSKP